MWTHWPKWLDPNLTVLVIPLELRNLLTNGNFSPKNAKFADLILNMVAQPSMSFKTLTDGGS